MRLRFPFHHQTMVERFDFYRQSDEDILGALTDLGSPQIDRLCHEARQLAATFEGLTPRGLAAREGWRIIEETVLIGDHTGAGIELMGECDFFPGRPAAIMINRTGIERVSRLALRSVGTFGDAWFHPPSLTDLTISHELYHLVNRAAGDRVSELAAHVFARAFTSSPFSPLLLHALLQQDRADRSRN